MVVREDTIRKLLIKYSQNGESIIYNFNKIVGDTLRMPGSGTNLTYTVSAIDSVFLGDGLYHRRFYYQPSNYNEYAIEGVGGKGGLFNFYRFKGEVSSGLMCHGTMTPNTTIFSQVSGGGSCPDFTGIKSQPTVDNNFSFYPNPSMGQLTVYCHARQKITITNQLGECLVSTESVESTTNIDVSGLVPGIYFVQLKVGPKLLVKKLLIN